MLGKLLKYEFKDNIFFYVIMTAVIAVMTIAACGSIELMIRTEMDNPYLTLSCISVIMLYIVILVAASIFTTVIIFKRFYSNNFSQEGYLTFTLPVKATDIYWSKYISALIWEIWTYGLIILSLSGIMLCPSFELSIADIMDIVNNFIDIFDMSIWVMLLYVLQITVSIVYAIVLMYLAICIGQNFNVHRVIGAVGAYFAVNWIVGIIGSVFSTTALIIWSVIEGIQYEYSVLGSYTADGYLITSLVIEILVYIGAIIGGYIYSIRKMSKGLNLK